MSVAGGGRRGTACCITMALALGAAGAAAEGAQQAVAEAVAAEKAAQDAAVAAETAKAQAIAAEKQDGKAAATSPSAPPKPTAPSPTAPSAAAPQPVAISGPKVITVGGEEIAGALQSIADGKLTLATTPPRTLALDDVQSIQLGAGASVALQWIGQDHRDLAKAANTLGPSGVEDLHLRLVGLPRGKKVQQIVVVCQYPKQSRVWRLEPGASPLWKIAIEQPAGAAVADLFLEPTAADSFELEYAATVTFDDSSSVKVSTKATTHASDQTKVSGTPAPAPTPSPAAGNEPRQPPAAAAAGPALVVHLDHQNQLRGRLQELSGEAVGLSTAWQAGLKVSLLKALAISFPSVNHADGQKMFAERLKKPGNEDVALIVGRDQKVAEVGGALEGFADGKVKFKLGDESRSIDPARLVGIVLAARPPAASSGAPYQVVQLTTGDAISGTLLAAGGGNLELATTWGEKLSLPIEGVARIDFRNGRLVYLSDVEPLSVEEVPYFSRRWSYRRDQGLGGAPLKIKGKSYARGLAVHSRCVLNYALEGEYATFAAVLGFDDEAAGRGAVNCRVLGDGKPLWAKENVHGAAEPLPIELAVAGVKVLSLEVDFGEGEDVGDRVIWAEARVLRAAKQ